MQYPRKWSIEKFSWTYSMQVITSNCPAGISKLNASEGTKFAIVSSQFSIMVCVSVSSCCASFLYPGSAAAAISWVIILLIGIFEAVFFSLSLPSTAWLTSAGFNEPSSNKLLQRGYLNRISTLVCRWSFLCCIVSSYQEIFVSLLNQQQIDA